MQARAGYGGGQLAAAAVTEVPADGASASKRRRIERLERTRELERRVCDEFELASHAAGGAVAGPATVTGDTCTLIHIIKLTCECVSCRAGALAVDDSDDDEGPPIDIREAAGLPMMPGESQADYANRILGSIGAAVHAGDGGSESHAGGGESPDYDPMPNDSEVVGGDVPLEPLPQPALLKKARVRPNPAVSVLALTINDFLSAFLRSRCFTVHCAFRRPY